MKDQKATFEQPWFGGSRITSNTGEHETHTYKYIYIQYTLHIIYKFICVYNLCSSTNQHMVQLRILSESAKEKK